MDTISRNTHILFHCIEGSQIKIIFENLHTAVSVRCPTKTTKTDKQLWTGTIFGISISHPHSFSPFTRSYFFYLIKSITAKLQQQIRNQFKQIEINTPTHYQSIMTQQDISGDLVLGAFLILKIVQSYQMRERTRAEGIT